MKASKLIIVIFLSVISIQAITVDNDKYFEILKNIEIFTNVYKELNTNYVDDIDPNKLMRTGLDAMVNSLDPFTNYISESQVESYRISEQGTYEGVGAIIKSIGDEVTVIEPFKNSAADKAGLVAGDIITKINGRSTENRDADEVMDFMRGAPGTSANMEIKRPGEEKPISITLNRQEVNIPNVPFFGEIKPGIGYVKLSTFTVNAGRNVRNALSQMKSENPDLKGIILDLRFNGGGLLMEAVNLCNVFIPAGKEVVSTKGKVKERNRTFSTKMAPEDLEIPVVVLINKRSASASEIVSGVLQDYDRAVLLGQRSYGKGLVQNTMNTGYNSRVKLTTSKYYIPSGRCIQSVEYENGEPKEIPDENRAKFKTANGREVLDGGGVKPDILFELEEDGSFVGALEDQFMIFDFVTDYLKTDTATLADGAVVFDEYDRFVDWFDLQEFDHTLEIEKEWESVKTAMLTSSLDFDESTFEEIDSKIASGKKDEIMQSKNAVIRKIEIELATRRNYQEGKARQTLKGDPEISLAIGLLNDTNRMNQILNK